MNRFLFIALAGLAAIGLGSQNLGVQPDATVTGKFVGENGAVVEGIGTCSATADAIDCWDMAGKRDIKLNEKMKMALQSRNFDFRVRFGSKNRFLLVQTSPSAYVSLSGSSSYGDTFGPLGESGDTRVFLIGLPYKSEDVTGEVVAQLYQYQAPKPIDMAFAKDSTVNTDGVKLRIASWLERKQGMPVDMGAMYIGQKPQPHRAWSIFLEGNFGAPEALVASYQAIGADGEPISWVDKSGNPVRGADFLRDQSGMDPQKPQVNAKYTVARFTVVKSVEGAQEIAFNVNPERISKLRLTRTRNFRVLIKGFPLDPQ